MPEVVPFQKGPVSERLGPQRTTLGSRVQILWIRLAAQVHLELYAGCTKARAARATAAAGTEGCSLRRLRRRNTTEVPADRNIALRSPLLQYAV